MNAAGDAAGAAKDQTVKGAKVAADGAKAVGAEAADKVADAGDKTVKVAKKSGNWFTRTLKKIF